MNRNIITKAASLIILFIFITQNGYPQDKNWTSFRGSNLNGVSTAKNIPLKWDESAIKWKTDIHDRGLSSPVVFGNQIWLTTASTDGKKLYALAIDFNTGKAIHDINVFSPGTVDGKHTLNSWATPTPVIENGFVYVHYGSMGTACINTNTGEIVWTVTDLKCKHVQGPASSPVLYKDLLILHFEGTDVRYIIALNKKTGATVWRTDRPVEPYQPLTVIGRKAYITPIIINVKGRDMLISNGSAVCQALDPLTGAEIWHLVAGAESTISMPFTEKGIVYWYTGYSVDTDGSKYTELFAVNPDGMGDISGTNIIWKKRDELSRNVSLSPLIKDGLIYTVNTTNNIKCIDAGNGDVVWSEHLNQNYDASPVYADNLIWFFSVKGEVIALKPGRKFEVVAKNQVDSGIWATPAFVRNSVIIRTEKALYRIAK